MIGRATRFCLAPIRVACRCVNSRRIAHRKLDALFVNARICRAKELTPLQVDEKDWELYGSSKAALNMLMKAFAARHPEDPSRRNTALVSQQPVPPP